MNRWFAIPIILAIANNLLACVPSPDDDIQTSTRIDPESAPLMVLARVESVEIAPSLAPQIEVMVNVLGSLANNCSSIDQIQQQRYGNEFEVRIFSLQQEGTDCSASRIPFERTIRLNIGDLPAGSYAVDVNGLKGTFRLPEKNIEDPANAATGGFIWHDVCLTTDDSTTIETLAETGCIDSGNGVLETNGLMDEWESGIGGIIVQLGEGRCPSRELATTITDNAGYYVFSGLRAGSYCITLDSSHSENALTLDEGSWTPPDSTEVAETSIDLGIGEKRFDVNFGWKIKPSPVEIVLPREDPCTDKALFISDVTIPDNTVIRPSVTFTKTWQLRNIGSCDWTADYQMVFSEGDQLNATDIILMPDVVKPGDDVDLSVLLTAPVDEGIYSGAWKLMNEDGELFGIGPGSDKAFWVRIIVES